MNEFRYLGYDENPVSRATPLKDKQRAEISADVEAFLKSGGQIRRITTGEQTPLTAWSRSGKSKERAKERA